MNELVKTDNYNGLTREDFLEIFEVKGGELLRKAISKYRPRPRKAGWVTECGYLRTKYNDRTYLNHRILFLIYHGWIPKNYRNWQIDHIDIDKLNNKENNLRCVTTSQNSMNCKSTSHSTSQYKGVHWHKAAHKWQVQIMKDGKPTYLGSFDSELEAARTYDKVAKELHGEYVNLNLPEGERI